MEDEIQAKIKQAVALERKKGRSDEEILQLGLQAGLPREKIEAELQGGKKAGVKAFIKPAIYGVLAALAIGGGVWAAQTYLIGGGDNELVDPITPPANTGDREPAEKVEEEGEKATDENKPDGENKQGTGPDDKKDDEGDEGETDTENDEIEDGSTAESEKDPLQEDGSEVSGEEADDEQSSVSDTDDGQQDPGETETEAGAEDDRTTYLFQGRKEIIPLSSPADFEIMITDSRVVNYTMESASIVMDPIKTGKTEFTITHKESKQGKTYQIEVLPGKDASRKLPLTLQMGKNRYLHDYSGTKTELILKSDGVIQAEKGRNDVIIITPQKAGDTTLSVIETEKNLTTVYQVEVVE